MANLAYINSISSKTQALSDIDVPQKILFDIDEELNDIENVESTFKVKNQGMYYYRISIQCSREDVCCLEIPNIRMWVRKNGTDIPNSSALININRLRETKDILYNFGLQNLEKGDVLEFYMASNINGVTKIESISKEKEPLIPSARLVISKISIESEDSKDCL